MSENNGDIGAFLAGFVIGGLVGAATALILAPQSGAETRSRLSQRSGDFRSMTGQRLGEFRERAGETLAEARNRAEEAGSQMQERSRIVLSEGRGKIGQVKDQVTGHVQKEVAEDEGEPPEAA